MMDRQIKEVMDTYYYACFGSQDFTHRFSPPRNTIGVVTGPVGVDFAKFVWRWSGDGGE